MQSTPYVKLLLGRNRRDCQIIILAKIANLTLFYYVTFMNFHDGITFERAVVSEPASSLSTASSWLADVVFRFDRPACGEVVGCLFARGACGVHVLRPLFFAGVILARRQSAYSCDSTRVFALIDLACGVASRVLSGFGVPDCAFLCRSTA